MVSRKILSNAKSFYDSLSNREKAHLNSFLHTIVMPVLLTFTFTSILMGLAHILLVWSLFEFTVKKRTLNKILFNLYLKIIFLTLLIIKIGILILVLTPS